MARPIHVSRQLTAIAIAGVALTLTFTAAARAAHEDNEDRLTRQRTLEAAAVLTAGISAVEVPLATGSALAEVTSADAALFRQVIESQVGPQQRFASASIWSVRDMKPVVVVGDEPALATQEPATIRSYFARSLATNALSVIDLLNETSPRVGYGFTSPGGAGDFLVYAESLLPPNRTAVVQVDSAFAGLDYALYLDTPERPESLLVASTADLPLRGRHAEEMAVFGDSNLRLVMSPTRTLGGTLLARLSWLVLGTGLTITLVAVVLAQRLQRRRRQAETLAEENAELYAEQRAASLTLQQSLLPRELPELTDLDIAVRYAPGVSGTEVGGDWYDVIDVGGRTVFVVGDVSGRGLPAASVMAAVRHSVRALAFEGGTPAAILQAVNRPQSIDLAGHFVTVLCGVLDLREGSLSVANAGHPPPLIVQDAGSAFVDVPVGPPIGASAGGSYETVTVGFTPGSTLVLYTDGVFERRGEPIDVGLERLRVASTQARGSTAQLVEMMFTELALGDGDDDAAILAARWTT